MMKTVSALTFRKQLGKYLDLVAKKKEHILISRANEPLVVMIPADEYDESAREAEALARRTRAVERMDILREQIRREVGPTDVVALVRRIRDSR